MEGLRPICSACSRYNRPVSYGDTGTCKAFPMGIPHEIFFGGYDHRQPFEGDAGVRFRLAEGAEPALEAYEEQQAILAEAEE